VERLPNLPSRPDERPPTGNRNTELIAGLGGSLSLSIVPHRFYMHRQSRRGDKHLYASRPFEVGVWPPAARGVGSMGNRSGVSVDLSPACAASGAVPAPEP
jgi:hypothetical protein